MNLELMPLADIRHRLPPVILVVMCSESMSRDSSVGRIKAVWLACNVHDLLTA